jgi:starch-binding outer membrane protein, SusD/RagB family
MKTKSIIVATLLASVTGLFYSCDGLLDTSSSLVVFSEDHQLDQAADSVYSVMGIIYKMQSIADRTVLIGEIKGDLVDVTPEASVDLQQLANFNMQPGNSYNAPSDYYAVINNCNFFLANVDTSIEKRNVPVFMKEYAAVKAFRAWTYLQLAKAYGSVPFVTTPILTEAMANKTYPLYNVSDLCNFFIDDLTPYLNTEYPGYGAINGLNSKKFFLPIRVLLGDFCLWSDRYMDAAHYYHDYLTQEGKEIVTGTSKSSWMSATSFDNWFDSYSSQFSSMENSEIISYIPMEESAADGVYSSLKDVFNSTSNNYYYFQATPSAHLFELSQSQSNCIIYQGITKRDTLYAPVTNENHPLWVGDLRLPSTFNKQLINQSANSEYSSNYQSLSKFSTRHVILYRRNEIYLRFAEALNRAGYPVSAFTILKYGLQPSNITKYIPKSERDSSNNLLIFNQYAFTADNTMGIHGRGCGEVQANVQYQIPALQNSNDTLLYVEDLICDESALETAFEGNRFFDLLRIAKRRNDPSWLADKIANRKGTTKYDAALYELVKKPENWYLPLE